MSKNKLLIAMTAGLFAATAATGAFAQTSSGNSSAGGDTSATTQGDMSGSATTKHKKPRKHSAHPSAGKKTPDASTGNNAAGEGGQSK